MYDSVRSNFLSFSTQFEGRVEFMYLDIYQYVTVGIGNLIDPVAHALALPFVYKNNTGEYADQAAIAAEWNLVKAGGEELARQGHTAARLITQLMLNQVDIDNLVMQKADQFEQTLKTGTAEFADFDNWPADAQLGLLSMAWAMGPAFAQGGRWPNFRLACAAQDWDTAAAESHIPDDTNPGLRPRNQANKTLFLNAARVRADNLPYDVLQFQMNQPGGAPQGGWPLLTEGSVDVRVTTLQLLLQEHGYPVIADGIFSPVITAAVAAFQAAQGLSADGKVGQDTWGRLILLRSLGDVGAAVSAIQDRLFFWDAGLVFPAPGVFDNVTETAVKAFQQASGLGADGKVGPNTWKSLINL